MKLQLLMSVLTLLSTTSSQDSIGVASPDTDVRDDVDAKSSESESVFSDSSCEYLGVFPTRCGDFSRAGIVHVVLGRYVVYQPNKIMLISATTRHPKF